MEALLARPGEVVSKDELLAAVWGETHVGEESLAQAVSVLRQALGDDPKEPGYLETIPRRGYRFIETVSLDAVGEPGVEAATAAAAGSHRPRLVVVATLLALVAAGLWFRRSEGPVATAALEETFATAQLTHADGREVDPALSPDGRFLLYSGNASGNYDIYWRRTEGGRAVNLTEDSEAGDYQPAWSADGSRIFFRSDRDGGGLFAMGATGEDLVRLTDSGFDPASSPDGQRIAFSSRSLLFPGLDYQDGELSILEIDIGSSRKPGVFGVQPSWSPDGERIVFARVNDGIWCYSFHDASVVRVTAGRALEMHPVWAADNWIYFSRRSGTGADLWRTRVDAAGRPLGAEQRLTAGESTIRGRIDLAPDGTGVVYSSETPVSNLARAGFDSESEEVSAPIQVTRGTVNLDWYSDISPDGGWLALIRQPGGDLAVVRRDGTGERRLRSDPAVRDRVPRFSPDGELIAFSSNTSGNEEIWITAVDGSATYRVSRSRGSAHRQPVWSPEGDRLAYTDSNGAIFLVEVRNPRAPGEPRRREVAEATGYFTARDWSPDGEWLAGDLNAPDWTPLGLAKVNVRTGELVQLTDFGSRPAWLSDGRRLLFSASRRMYLLDTGTGDTSQVLDLTPDLVAYPRLSADDSEIGFVVASTQADIWRLQKEPDPR